MQITIKIILLLFASIAVSCSQRFSGNKRFSESDPVVISKNELQDKIKGGWAGQVIGCSYGGPTEFKWNGTMIDAQVPIPWDENTILWWYDNFPGLYDDVYMDLTFVDVFDKHGLDAADSLHALAFARAEYPLWHANQAARHNILNGIMPPASGHWKNNPHADDIDFQIESDFAGLMSPGMVNSASAIGNRIGHIMNYGDGVYGGIYVASMYALAFVYDDIEFIVSEALRTIPAESEFRQCIAGVIESHHKDPHDWRTAWFDAQKNWTSEKGCPDGIFGSFNIDAKINAAYIVIGLLYGQGDFGATIDISTRCGYDSDCNPANAAGILGTMAGYSKIPDLWRKGLEKVEGKNFSFTTMSLDKVYETGFRQASEMIIRNGGKEEGENLVISYQVPRTVPFEAAFEGLYPTVRKGLNQSLSEQNPEVTVETEGCGFVITGHGTKGEQMADAVLEAVVYADGQLLENIKIPTQWLVRRHDIAWNYELPEGKHTISLKIKHVPEGYGINLGDLISYSANDPGAQVQY